MTTPTSTININNPPANAPVASTVVRSNFRSAASDIDAIWAYVYGLISGVSSFNGRTGDITLLSSDVTNALGYNPGIKSGNLQWIVPANTGTPISLIPYAQYAFTISRLNKLCVSSGSLTMTLLVDSVPITGLDNLSVTTSPLNPSATAGNSVAVGQELTMIITNSVTPSNLKFSMLSNM